jgi:hypothetical protein
MINCKGVLYAPKEEFNNLVFTNQQVKILVDYAIGANESFDFLDEISGELISLVPSDCGKIKYIKK